MSEDNRKVNSSPRTEAERKAIDEITDGFFDLSQLYSSTPKKKPQSDKGLSREEALRRKDEMRRELEMQAIKEDIERRYSIDLENAQQNIDSSVSTEPQPEKKPLFNLELETPVVDEEISRIDELINDNTVGGVKNENADSTEKSKKKRKTKKKKEAKVDNRPELDPSDYGAIYFFIYTLGDLACKGIAKLFKTVFGIILIPLLALEKFFGKATEDVKRRIKMSVHSTADEIGRFRREIKSANKIIGKSIRKPKAFFRVLLGYFVKAFRRHSKLLKTTFNIALPVLSLLVFLASLNYWNSVTFALEVVYNEDTIGYISDESVYIEAKELVSDRMSSGAYIGNGDNSQPQANSLNLKAEYVLTLVSLDELNDAQTISDKIIENSVDNLTHACGIYIDGDFVCAVKNEADAKTVFHTILAPYEEQAKDGGYSVGFAQDIDYVQGLYSDNETVMWDAAKLTETMENPKQSATIYTVAEGDSLASIANAYDVDEEYIASLNPNYDFDDIQPGDLIVAEKAVKHVNIQKTVTTNRVREVEFEIVKKSDPTKYSGYSSVTQEGVNGTERVTTTKIYVDDVLVETNYDYETLVEPIDEIRTVGTKTYYDGVYIGSASDSGFLWPAPSCHYVSSPYGWRSSGWHNGIDLVKSGGGASGTPVIASRSGVVEVVQRSNSGYGNMVLINHGDGYKTRYAHMISGSITVSVGEYVEAGRTIGKVGSTGNSTGPHLHFEVIYNGETYDPKKYIYS